jgi:serine/threonine protein kinase
LIDFGESRILKKQGRMTVVGTPFYEAPEGTSLLPPFFSLLLPPSPPSHPLVMEGMYTIKVDSYSFGKLLYELITKCTSPASLGDPEFYKDPEVRIPGLVDANIQKLVTSCCNTNPAMRPNFEVISNELLKLYDFYFNSEKPGGQ